MTNWWFLLELDCILELSCTRLLQNVLGKWNLKIYFDTTRFWNSCIWTCIFRKIYHFFKKSISIYLFERQSDGVVRERRKFHLVVHSTNAFFQQPGMVQVEDRSQVLHLDLQHGARNLSTGPSLAASQLRYQNIVSETVVWLDLRHFKMSYRHPKWWLKPLLHNTPSGLFLNIF